MWFPSAGFQGRLATRPRPDDRRIWGGQVKHAIGKHSIVQRFEGCYTARLDPSWPARSPTPTRLPQTPSRMVNRNLIRELELGDELDQELELALAGTEEGEYSIGTSILAVNSVLEGRVLRVDREFVLVDVGYKSEGHIPRNEWDESEPPPQPSRPSWPWALLHPAGIPGRWNLKMAAGSLGQ